MAECRVPLTRCHLGLGQALRDAMRLSKLLQDGLTSGTHTTNTRMSVHGAGGAPRQAQVRGGRITAAAMAAGHRCCSQHYGQLY